MRLYMYSYTYMQPKKVNYLEDAIKLKEKIYRYVFKYHKLYLICLRKRKKNKILQIVKGCRSVKTNDNM